MRLRARIALTVGTILMAAGAVGFASGAAQASTPCTGSPFVNHYLSPGSTFFGGTYICSGGYEFINQNDGNLVIYNSAGNALWASNTDTGLPLLVDMQTDGNFVKYYTAGGAAWSTRTSGNPGAYVCFQRDGNMVIYAPSGSFSCSGRALWASGT
jgi:hypothetical protein